MRMGESVIAGNRLDSPGKNMMELFVAKAAICAISALRDGASGSGDIVGVPSVAIIANLCGTRGPRWMDSGDLGDLGDPGGYEKQGRDAEAEEPRQFCWLAVVVIWVQNACTRHR